MTNRACRQELLDLGARAAAAGLVSASCGNASLRCEPSSIVITGSGSELGHLVETDLSELTLAGETLRGPRPSCELGMHLAVYRARPEAQAVLHTHAQWATLMACSTEPVLDLDFTVEMPLLVGRHVYVPYAPPGSAALADSVGRAVSDPKVGVVQLQNHGQVALGGSWREALHRLIVFERACWMALQNVSLRRLP